MEHDKCYQTRGLLLQSKKRFIVTVDRRLEEMPYAQAGIRDLRFEDGPYSVLFSYDVGAAWIDGNDALTVTQYYSMASIVRRHVIAFIHQICAERCLDVPSLKDIGKIAGRDKVIFLRSGLICDRYNGFDGGDNE